MRRRKYGFIVATAAIACLCGALAACGGDGDGDNTTKIEDVVINVSSDANGTALSWAPVDGVDFVVYRSDTRYGEYEFAEGDIRDGSFSDDSRMAYYKVEAYKGGELIRTFNSVSEEISLLGKNTYVFSPDDNPDDVKRALDGIFSRQYDEKTAEFTSRRYSILFKEGVYDDKIKLDSGYYTTFAGLGDNPADTSVNTLLCKDGTNGNGCINFWRGAENFTVRSNTTWAVSQGAYLRSMNIVGNLSFHYASFVSGGFFADSYVSGTVSSGGQQQWLSRNCGWSNWQGSVWNMCFAGVDGAPAERYDSGSKYTVDAKTTMREKPFLVYDDQNLYRIAVPALREDASGYSWKQSNADNRIERYVEMDDIYFANPDSDTAATINAAIAGGKDVILTPGIYSLDAPIEIKRDDAILLGTGMATLLPTGANKLLLVEGCEDVSIGGILFDAGNVENDLLVSIGTENSTTRAVNMYDTFYRIGGAEDKNTYASTAVRVYADDCIGDNMWVWRADHDNGVGWDKNNADNGLEVYGDNVKIYGLMSEHFKKYNVLWKGENGYVFFYQSEIAYDVPSQEVWMDGSKNGYASFKVADTVNNFKARGLGIYSNFHNENVVLDNAMEVPNASGVTVEHICTVRLNSQGCISNVINGIGGSTPAGVKPQYVVQYPTNV